MSGLLLRLFTGGRPSLAVSWGGRRIEVEGYTRRATQRLGSRLIRAVDPS